MTYIVRIAVDFATEGMAVLTEEALIVNGETLSDEWREKAAAAPDAMKVLLVNPGDRVRVEGDEMLQTASTSLARSITLTWTSVSMSSPTKIISASSPTHPSRRSSVREMRTRCCATCGSR